MRIDLGEINFGKLDICLLCDSNKTCPKLARLRSICKGDILEWKICPTFIKNKNAYLKLGKRDKNNGNKIL